MRWFRYYDDALDDPKVQRLAPHLFKTWVNLLCLASKLGGKLPSDDDIAFRLRMSIQDTSQQLEDLILFGLIDLSPAGERIPHNWKNRQFASDSSAARVRDHRARNKKAERNAECNVTRSGDVTPQNRTDAEKEIELEIVQKECAGAPSKAFIRNGLGRDGRGVSPLLIRYSEGFGQPIEELLREATKPGIREPGAKFRALAKQDLQTRLPAVSPRLVANAFTRTGDAARATIYSMLMEIAQ